MSWFAWVLCVAHTAQRIMAPMPRELHRAVGSVGTVTGRLREDTVSWCGVGRDGARRRGQYSTRIFAYTGSLGLHILLVLHNTVMFTVFPTSS